jgi:D-sedoheptulose 7-phosphate isomerase
MPSTRKRMSQPSLADLKIRVAGELAESAALKQRLLDVVTSDLARGVRLWADALSGGHKILLCGNGGSAADAQHAATELVVRLKRKRPALPALALTTDTSLLTAAANDYGFEKIFERQVEALGEPGDVLVAISTSGNSANVVRAARTARAQKLKVMALTGPAPNKLALLAHVNLAAPSDDTQRIQEAHITLLHILCRQTEYLLFRR